MILLRADDMPATPWKNGGGVTRDLLVDAPDWRWRISLADIGADGPFSAFPGVERWFAVVVGAGVELRFGAERVEVRAHDAPLAFDGATAPMCRLLAGPTRDLNLMLRGGARGVMRRAAIGIGWTEDWPLRGHFDNASRTLEWDLPAGPLAARGSGCWIGVAP